MGCCLSFLHTLFGDNIEDTITDPILSDNVNDNVTEDQQPLREPEGDNPVYYSSPGVGRPLNELSEDEQINLARKIEFLDQMPSTVLDQYDKIQECVICMVDIEIGETIRYLPCAHLFHKRCVDTWLMRSLSCPTCMEELTEVKEYLSNVNYE